MDNIPLQDYKETIQEAQRHNLVLGLLGGITGHEHRAGVRPSSSLIQHIVSTLLSVSTHWGGRGGVVGVSDEPEVYVHVPNQVPYLIIAGFHSQLFFH